MELFGQEYIDTYFGIDDIESSRLDEAATCIESAAEYFYSGGGWTQGRLEDHYGNRCVLGALQGRPDTTTFTRVLAGRILDHWLVTQDPNLDVGDDEDHLRPSAFYNDHLATSGVDVADKLMECAKDLRNRA